MKRAHVGSVHLAALPNVALATEAKRADLNPPAPERRYGSCNFNLWLKEVYFSRKPGGPR